MIFYCFTHNMDSRVKFFFLTAKQAPFISFNSMNSNCNWTSLELCWVITPCATSCSLNTSKLGRIHKIKSFQWNMNTRDFAHMEVWYRWTNYLFSRIMLTYVPQFVLLFFPNFPIFFRLLKSLCKELKIGYSVVMCESLFIIDFPLLTSFMLSGRFWYSSFVRILWFDLMI